MCFYTEARLRKSKSLLEEALKHGFEECRTVVCLLVGVAGAGKTHSKHLLFGWTPPEFRNSTPLAVRPVQAIRVQASTQGGQLQEVDPEQLDKILADTVAKGGVPLERKSCCKCKCFYHQTTSAGISPIVASPRSYGATERPVNLHLKKEITAAAIQLHIPITQSLNRLQKQH